MVSTTSRFSPEGDEVDDLARLAAHGVTPPYVAFGPATLEPRKGIPTLLAAFARVAPRHPDLRLALVGGDGWGVSEVRDAIAASGVATHVVRTGYVDHDVVPALYRRAAAVAYPTLEEGFGLPALEALAAGAPLVTTTGSAPEEIVGRGGAHGAAGRLRRAGRRAANVARGRLPCRGPQERRSGAGPALHVGAVCRAARGHLPGAARMKALVTGASGFAGRHLVAHLTEAGDSVIACDRAGVHAVDIVDRDAVHQAFASFQPEVVYHLAALTHVGDSWNEPQAVLRVNVEGTLNVLDAAQAAGVRRVLVVGSAEEYGRVRAPNPRCGRTRRCSRILPTRPRRSQRRTSRCRPISVPDSRRCASARSTTPVRARPIAS